MNNNTGYSLSQRQNTAGFTSLAALFLSAFFLMGAQDQGCGGDDANSGASSCAASGGCWRQAGPYDSNGDGDYNDPGELSGSGGFCEACRPHQTLPGTD